ncbi:hypothetical protein BDP27DRAFT_1446005 [Rhodocollybia butyracea]|uniref:DUF7330 domain-containing protein n=1 Tax=Rhodocollybia butyracea TaxID=206335 RepID=A0A9P5UA96_9AGAR|nr:hypothetical protein BDP27DRAFT_1446005 [Rhodocollybia butyracea]
MILPTEKPETQNHSSILTKFKSFRNSGKRAQTQAEADEVAVGNVEEDAPPEYDEATEESSSNDPSLPSPLSTSVSPTSESVPATSVSPTSATIVSHITNAVNNISVSQPLGSIQCSYTIDPTLKFPLPGRRTDHNTSPNVKLRTNYGTIDAELTIYSGKHGEDLKSNLVEIDVGSKVGAINLILRRQPSSSRTTPTPIIRCFVSSHTGAICVRIPRDFLGFIITHSNVARLTLNPSLKSHASVVKAEMTKTKIFVGDSSALRTGVQSEFDELERWKGDEIIVKTYVGNMEFGYVEEESFNGVP